MLSELEQRALRAPLPDEPKQDRPRRRAKPTPRIGDIVLADRCWYLVTRKEGQRMCGKLVGARSTQAGWTFAEHRFTSRQVERVFRELGVRAR
jgi:hypothetical protein